MGVKHNYQSATTNDGAKEVSSTRWNEDHVISGQVDFPDVASPSTPAAGVFSLFGYSWLGQTVPAYIAADGRVQIISSGDTRGRDVARSQGMGVY